MNIDAKISIKYWQNKFYNALKRSYTMTESDSFQGYKDGSTYANH
jgi:hypothetical protein